MHFVFGYEDFCNGQAITVPRDWEGKEVDHQKTVSLLDFRFSGHDNPLHEPIPMGDIESRSDPWIYTLRGLPDTRG